jgi:hypothetical protein
MDVLMLVQPDVQVSWQKVQRESVDGEQRQTTDDSVSAQDLRPFRSWAEFTAKTQRGSL